MSKLIVSINSSSAELLKLANGRSAQRDAARAEIARRVDKRHLNGKAVTKAMQAIANAWQDAQDVQVGKAAKTVVKAKAAKIAKADAEYNTLVNQLIDSGKLRWDGDVLVPVKA